MMTPTNGSAAWNTPRLSVVVAMTSDTADGQRNTLHLAECLAALRQQIAAPPLEILVPYYPPVAGLDELRGRYPGVSFLACEPTPLTALQGGSREHHGALCARGMQAARGDIVALLEDHERPDPHWAAAVVAAHQQPYAAIGGPIENDIDQPLNWAVYFCDFARYQNPLPAGPSLFASDVNVAYKRQALEGIRPVWHTHYDEPLVHAALLSKGETLALAPNMVVYQYRLGLRLESALRERVVWGRSYSAGRVRQASVGRRAVYAILTPLLPAMLVTRMARTVFSKGRSRRAFLQALPLTLALLIAWAWGEGLGYLTGQPHATRPPLTRPFRHAERLGSLEGDHPP